MKKDIALIVLLLVGMELVGWWLYQKSKKQDGTSTEIATEMAQPAPKALPGLKKGQPAAGQEAGLANGKQQTDEEIGTTELGAASFPPPAVEIVDGVAQRTIHMGVRQWQWDPAQLDVNYGEKVILIMHNADVPHSISVPELNVKVAIPEEGAVVMFTADKRGTFDFFCDTPCGRGHSQMRGKITIL